MVKVGKGGWACRTWPANYLFSLPIMTWSVDSGGGRNKYISPWSPTCQSCFCRSRADIPLLTLLLSLLLKYSELKSKKRVISINTKHSILHMYVWNRTLESGINCKSSLFYVWGLSLSQIEKDYLWKAKWKKGRYWVSTEVNAQAESGHLFSLIKMTTSK